MPYYIVGRSERYALINKYDLSVNGTVDDETVAKAANARIAKLVADMGFVWAPKKNEICVVADSPEAALEAYQKSKARLHQVFFDQYEIARTTPR